MEETKKRALKLADIIASSEEPFSKVIDEAKQELREHLKNLDGKTQKEIMERIRGYS
ncbi:MAG: hypothetical protein HY694_16180 [Deltaproteobacteria bacterium]|jgi:hypothetical protein|nr:hypothetical protein [Deltaproteobacteria bacterium]